jgi:hypothetical protein
VTAAAPSYGVDPAPATSAAGRLRWVHDPDDDLACLRHLRRPPRTRVDRPALYVRRSWTTDRNRCTAAGVPEDITFATKPALATTLIARAVTAGVPAAWVSGDEVYGADPALRRTVRQLGLGYVLQVAGNRRVPTHAGPVRVDQLPATLLGRAW